MTRDYKALIWSLTFGGMGFLTLHAAFAFLFWRIIDSQSEPTREVVASMALLGWFVLGLGVSYLILARSPLRNRLLAYPALTICVGLSLWHLPEAVPAGAAGTYAPYLLSVIFAATALLHVVFLFTTRSRD